MDDDDTVVKPKRSFRVRNNAFHFQEPVPKAPKKKHKKESVHKMKPTIISPREESSVH